jgi:hypothetical protein
MLPTCGHIKATAGRFRLLLTPMVLGWSAALLACGHIENASANEVGVVSLITPTLANSRPPGMSSPAELPKRANFLGEVASAEAQQVANWAVSSGDHGTMPFLIIDKVRAKVFVFDNTGVLRGATMALLGKARGDDSPPGIGDRPLMAIRPDERITPAGRFVAVLGRDFKQDVLWIDYNTAISLHRVVTGNPGDHRRERLATLSTLDKRISYGCINVPPQFYDGVVLQTFTGTSGVAYILPEVHKLGDVFPLAAGG